MKNIVFAALLIAFAEVLLAQSKETPVWRDLFNGKNLSGWKQLNGKAKFEVSRGEIVGTTIPGEPNSFLVTEERFSDFILEFEFKASGVNSGVQFRSDSKPSYQDGVVYGYQFEIDPSSRQWTGGIYDESRRRWLYPLELNPQAKKAFQPDAWNKARVECIGNTIRTFINGVPAAHLVDTIVTDGFIALQVHAVANEDAGKQTRFRNIRIQTTNLVPSPWDSTFVVNLVPNTLSDQEKANGISLLWDGRTTTGWRGAYRDAFPDKGWEIGEGFLRVLKSTGAESENGGDIVTVNEYSAFELQFEFRLTEGANSGVKYFVTEKEFNKGSAIGLEYQILDDARHPDAKMGVNGNRTLASLYDLIPSLKSDQIFRPIGKWNSGRIIVYPDNRVEHWLNGYKVVEYQRGSTAYWDLVSSSKYKIWENFGMADKGRILLQDHGDEVSFRSIKIKVLK